MNSDFLVITQTVTGVLLVISEILGLSKCKSNGLVDFILNTIMCKEEPQVQKIDLCRDEESPIIYQIQTTNPLVARRVATLAASDAFQLGSRMDNAQPVLLPE